MTCNCSYPRAYTRAEGLGPPPHSDEALAEEPAV